MIRVSWYSAEENIILWEAGGLVSIRDYHAAFEQTTALMQVKKHPVDVIRINMLAQQMPHDFIYTLLALHKRRNRLIDQQGIIVIVNPSSVVRIMYRVLNKLPASLGLYYFASSLEDALQIIKAYRHNNGAAQSKL